LGWLSISVKRLEEARFYSCSFVTHYYPVQIFAPREDFPDRGCPKDQPQATKGLGRVPAREKGPIARSGLPKAGKHGRFGPDSRPITTF